MLKKFSLLVTLFCLCFATMVFADIPDPSGWPRPRPRPHPRPTMMEEFRITRFDFHNPDEYKDKLAVDMVCLAPENSVISYRVEALDFVYDEGTADIEQGEKTITVYFPRLDEKGEFQAELNIECKLNERETPFGKKRTDEDVYCRTSKTVFWVVNDGESCSITQK